MKKFVSLLAMLIIAIAVVGCTPRERRNEHEIEDLGSDYKTKISATVTFWHAMGQANQGVIAEIITEFNKEYPNITVVQQSQGGYTDLRDKILTTLSSGNNPTIAQTYPDHVAAYLQGKAVRELDSYINHARYGMTQEEIEDFIPAYFEEGKIYDTKGTLYSLPFNKSTEVMFYNKTWFYNTKVDGVSLYEKYNLGTVEIVDEKPVFNDNPDAFLSWEDIIEICEVYINSEAYQALSNDDKLKHAGFAADSEANLFITLTQQFGGEYTSLEEPRFRFNNPQSKAAMQWFFDNKEAGLFGTSTKFGTDYSSDAFKAGQIKMTIGSSAGANYNYPGDPDSTFHVGILPYPQFEDVTQFGGIQPEKGQVIQQGTNVTLFKCTDPMEELAGWLFIRFLTGYKAAMIWATKTGYFPIRNSVRTSQEYEDFLSGKKLLLDANTGEWTTIYEPSFIAKTMKVGWEQRNIFYTSPAFPGSSDCRDVVEALVQAVLYGGVSIDQAYEDALDELE